MRCHALFQGLLEVVQRLNVRLASSQPIDESILCVNISKMLGLLGVDDVFDWCLAYLYFVEGQHR